MNTYEILFIECDLYYINYYKYGLEHPPITIKLDKDNYSKWKIDKLEK